MTKGSKSASEYLCKIKVIVNTLILIGDPVSFCDHLEIIFDGLPEEFDALTTLVYNHGTLCSINEVESMIVSHEAHLDSTRKKQLGGSMISANVAHVVTLANSSSQVTIAEDSYQTEHRGDYSGDCGNGGGRVRGCGVAVAADMFIVKFVTK